MAMVWYEIGAQLEDIGVYVGGCAMTQLLPQPALSRRHILASAGALSVGICLPRPSTAATAIVSTIFGGKFEEVYRATIIEPFRKKFGNDVTLKLGSGSQWLTTAVVSKANPEIDVLWLAFPESIKAINEDLAIELLPAELPNLTEVEPIWYDTYKKKGVGLDYASFGIAYRTDRINPAPTSWNDFWKPEYKGRLAMPDLTASGGYETLVMAAKLNGGSETNIEPGFAAMKKLRPSVRKFYRSNPEAAQMFESGEADLGAWFDGRTWALADGGMPIRFTVPKEGATVGMVSYHIMKNTPKMEVCKQFVNFAISIEAQEGFCNGMQYGPVNRKAKLIPPASDRVPPLKELLMLDWFKIEPQMSTWLDRWNREIVG
jgi:putative spermidine/putrescine transport system substrate-binding protein